MSHPDSSPNRCCWPGLGLASLVVTTELLCSGLRGEALPLVFLLLSILKFSSGNKVLQSRLAIGKSSTDVNSNLAKTKMFGDSFPQLKRISI